MDHRVRAPNCKHEKAQVSQLSSDKHDTALWQVTFRVPHLSSVSDHCTDVCNRLDQPACYSKLGPQFGHHSDLAPRCIQCHSSTHLAYDTSVCYGHRHKNQGLDPLIHSVSRVTTAPANASLVFQLFSFLVACSGMISKGFGFVAFVL